MNLSKEEKLQIAKKLLRTNKKKIQYTIFNLYKDDIKNYLELKIPKNAILALIEEELNTKLNYISFLNWLKKNFSDTNKTNKQNNNQTSNTTSQENRNDNKKAIQTNQNDKQDTINTTPASDVKPKRRLTKEEMAEFDKLLNDLFKVGKYWE